MFLYCYDICMLNKYSIFHDIYGTQAPVTMIMLKHVGCSSTQRNISEGQSCELKHKVHIHLNYNFIIIYTILVSNNRSYSRIFEKVNSPLHCVHTETACYDFSLSRPEVKWAKKGTISEPFVLFMRFPRFSTRWTTVDAAIATSWNLATVHFAIHIQFC